MITIKKINCAVCGEEVPYTDVKNPPTTCWRKMCQTNYAHVSGRKTIQGKSPDPKEVGVWQTYENSENSSN